MIFIQSHPTQYHAPLYRYLAAQGMEPEVWYGSDRSIRGSRDAEFGQEVQWDIPLLEGYKHRFFANEATAEAEERKGFFSIRNPTMLEALRQLPPATVVVPGWNFWTYIQVLRKAKAMGHTLVFRGETHHGMEMQRPAWKSGLRWALLRRLLRHVDTFCYIGQQSRRFYEWLGVSAEKLIFTPYAVDNQRFQQAAASISRMQARQQHGLPKEAFVILFSGKYMAKKRPLDLLEAFSRLPQPHARLVMVGEGELRGQMESFIAANGLAGRVTLTGFVNQSAIPAWYAAADCLVMCSDWGETWGLSVNEAMNFSLPVIVSNRCGCAEDLVQPGVNGWIFETGDIAALTGHLQQLAEMNATQRHAMGLASLQRVNEYGFGQTGQYISRRFTPPS